MMRAFRLFRRSTRPVGPAPGAGPVLSALVFLLAVAGAGPATAEFYRYVGEDGRPVYVDDLGKVPPRFRDQVRPYSEVEGSEEKPAPLPGGDVLNPARLQPGEMTEHATPVLIRNDRVFVEATIGYGILTTDVLLVLDTGASSTTLFRHAVEQIYMRGLNRTVGRSASGNAVEVELATVDFIRVGPHRKERLRTGIIDLDGKKAGYDGFLGMDFLRGIDFTIDFDRELIVWK